MAETFTPLIYLSAAVILFFLALAVLRIRRRFFYRRERRAELKVIEFSGDRETMKKIFKLFAPPFSIEIAVHQIGKKIHNYLIVPAAYLDKTVSLSGGREVRDYNIYHPGGINLGYSLKTKDNSSASLDAFLRMLKDLDFSKVDEIGEGAMFQLILGERPNGNLFIGNARILVSAPTPHQAEEIVESLKKGLSGCRWGEEKDHSFIDAATYRKLGRSEGVGWTVS